MSPQDEDQPTGTIPEPNVADLLQRLQQYEERLLHTTGRLDDVLNRITSASEEVETEDSNIDEAAEEETPSRLSMLAGLLAQGATLVIIWIALFQNSLDPGGASLQGMSASFNRQLTENVSYSELYAQYRAYTTYTLNRELQEQLELALANTTEETPAEEILLLNQELEQARRTAASSRLFFSLRYLNPDGTYNRERQLGELWAQAEQQLDLDPMPHFVAADEYRSIGMRSIGLLLWLTVALCLYELINYFSQYRFILRWSSMLAASVGVIFVVAVMVSLWFA
jgi:hypothetical protein